MRKMKQLVDRLAMDESGQDLVEYALVAGLIGLGAVAALTGLQHSIANLLSAVSNRLTSMP